MFLSEPWAAGHCIRLRAAEIVSEHRPRELVWIRCYCHVDSSSPLLFQRRVCAHEETSTPSSAQGVHTNIWVSPLPRLAAPELPHECRSSGGPLPIPYEIARGKPPSDDRRTIDTNSYGSCHLAPGTHQTIRCGARCSAARFPVSVGLCSDRAALRLMPRMLQVASTSPVANDLFPWSSASYRQGHSALDATHRHSWP